MDCVWVKAPDDPCCKVPICDKANKKNLTHYPDAQSSCISKAGKKYQIGQSWDTETNCSKKSCQCSLLPNGTTKILCNDENRCLSVPDIPPPDMPCPPAMAYRGHLPGIKYNTHYYKYAIILKYLCIYLIRR
jgi:hypothetical protein